MRPIRNVTWGGGEQVLQIFTNIHITHQQSIIWRHLKYINTQNSPKCTCSTVMSEDDQAWIFFKIFIAKKVCTACTRTSYKTVPLTNLNKYVHNDTSETELNINRSVNNSSEKFYKRTATFIQLIIAAHASIVYVSCTCLSSWLQYNYRFVGLGGWGVTGSEQKNLAVSQRMIKGMSSLFTG
jgi:hypothetical protein